MLSGLAQYKGSMPRAPMVWGPGNTVELYRRFLSYVVYRLQRSREGARVQDGYEGAKEFESDLVLLRSSLMSHRGERLAETFVDPVLRQLQTFGFHLHALDIRQHARVHAEVLEEIGTGKIDLNKLPPGNTEARSTKLRKTELKMTAQDRAAGAALPGGSEWPAQGQA